jgi:hypothetical protein
MDSLVYRHGGGRHPKLTAKQKQRLVEATRRLRVSITMPPTVLYHMHISLYWPQADLLLSMEPNASLQLLPKAGAQRTLEAVSCKALFGCAWVKVLAPLHAPVLI